MSTDIDPSAERTLPEWLSGRYVDDFANVGILSCPAEAPLEEVAWLMADNRVHALVVEGDDRNPPVISDSDLIAAVGSGHFDELSARDVAGTEAVSISRSDTLERATQLLTEHSVTHLVVRDDRWQPVGILSTLDVAKAISGR
ncbi:MAG: CBS domain-containing protein [Solirubrobacterales bacterium]|nr:CBS domain-containing protein [Solirubrobacterales bacterium]